MHHEPTRPVFRYRVLLSGLLAWAGKALDLPETTSRSPDMTKGSGTAMSGALAGVAR